MTEKRGKNKDVRECRKARKRALVTRMRSCRWLLSAHAHGTLNTFLKLDAKRHVSRTVFVVFVNAMVGDDCSGAHRQLFQPVRLISEEGTLHSRSHASINSVSEAG